MKEAKVITKPGIMTPNGRELRYELRHGKKGTGELIQSVTFWPWSAKSVEKANDIIAQAADKAEVSYTY